MVGRGRRLKKSSSHSLSLNVDNLTSKPHVLTMLCFFIFLLATQESLRHKTARIFLLISSSQLA